MIFLLFKQLIFKFSLFFIILAVKFLFSFSITNDFFLWIGVFKFQLLTSELVAFVDFLGFNIVLIIFEDGYLSVILFWLAFLVYILLIFLLIEVKEFLLWKIYLSHCFWAVLKALNLAGLKFLYFPSTFELVLVNELKSFIDADNFFANLNSN